MILMIMISIENENFSIIGYDIPIKSPITLNGVILENR